MRQVGKLAFVSLVVISTFLVTGCQKEKNQSKAAPIIQVTTLEAAPSTQPYNVDVFGQTEGSKAVSIYPQITGPIVARHYEEGLPVKKGDVLFTIEPAPFEAAYQSAQAAVVQAQVNLEKAKREAKRYSDLHRAKAVSEKTYTDALSDLRACEANLKAARAKEKEAKITLDYTQVRSPVDGIAGRALINPGSLVNANSTLLTDITQDNELKARFSISDHDLHGFDVTSDSPVVIIADRYPEPIDAKINFAATQIDPQTGTRSLSAEIDPQSGLLPGQYVTVRLTLGTQDGVFLIPQKAVRQLSDGTYSVYLLKDGLARQTPVTVGRWLGEDWIITSGIKEGDKVIVDQIQRLKDKAKVTEKQNNTKQS